MKKSEILEMVEDALPKYIHIESIQDIYEAMVFPDEVVADEVVADLKPGKYGMINLRLAVNIDVIEKPIKI